MTENPSYPRITVERGKMGGSPCIRGYRMPVATILRLLGNGWSREQILSDWDWMEPEDIDQALGYAAEALVVSHDVDVAV